MKEGKTYCIKIYVLPSTHIQNCKGGGAVHNVWPFKLSVFGHSSSPLLPTHTPPLQKQQHETSFIFKRNVPFFFELLLRLALSLPSLSLLLLGILFPSSSTLYLTDLRVLLRSLPSLVLLRSLPSLSLDFFLRPWSESSLCLYIERLKH